MEKAIVIGEKSAAKPMQETSTPTFTLGPLPWSEETLREAYFKDFRAAWKAIQEHPGYAAHSARKSLKTSFSIFRKAVGDLITALENFERASADRRLFGRPRRHEFEQLVLSVEKEVFAAASAAKSLVDHSRNVQRDYPVPAYSQQVTKLFGPENDFIQDLRDYANHNRVAPVTWRQHWKIGMVGFLTEFRLRRDVLLQTGKWSASARTFLEVQGEGVNLRDLFVGYLHQVTTFQEWFWSELEGQCKEQLSEYPRYRRCLNAIGSRAVWTMLIQQALAGDLDVYKYLDLYLTPDEMRRVQELPNHSAAQVDLLIEILDEYGSCDDALRADIYRAFKVPGME